MIFNGLYPCMRQLTSHSGLPKPQTELLGTNEG
jgi:hypothetical protein